MKERMGRWAGPLGGVLLLLGLAIIFATGMRFGGDFYTYYYPSGQRWLRGENPFILRGDPLRLAESARGELPPVEMTWYGGTPTTCALMAPLSLLPLPLAKGLWTFLSAVSFLAGIWYALKVIGPHWSEENRLFLLGLTACASSVRWNAGQLQMQLLCTGALGLFLYAVHRRNNRLALVSGFFTFLKLNLFPIPILILLFKGKYRLLALLLAMVIGLDMLAAARTGFVESYAGFRLALSNYAAPGSNNYPDAKAWIEMMRGTPRPAPQVSPGIVAPDNFNYTNEMLHWIYLFSAWMPVTMATQVAMLCSLLTLAALYPFWRRRRLLDTHPELLLRLFVLSVFITLLILPHLRYDAVLLTLVFPITIALWQRERRLEVGVMLVLSGFLGYVMMGDKMYGTWLDFIVKPGERAWLIPMSSYLLTVGLFASFGAVQRYLRRDVTQSLDRETLLATRLEPQF